MSSCTRLITWGIRPSWARVPSLRKAPRGLTEREAGVWNWGLQPSQACTERSRLGLPQLPASLPTPVMRHLACARHPALLPEVPSPPHTAALTIGLVMLRRPHRHEPRLPGPAAAARIPHPHSSLHQPLLPEGPHSLWQDLCARPPPRGLPTTPGCPPCFRLRGPANLTVRCPPLLTLL